VDVALVSRAALIGRCYQVPDQVLDAASARAYAQAVAEEPAQHLDRGLAPPFAVARFLAPLWRKVYQDPELSTEDRLVLHAAHRMRFHRPVPLGQRIRLACRITGLVRYGLGEAAIIRSAVDGADGRRLVTGESTLAMPGPATGLPAPRRGHLPAAGVRVATVPHRFAPGAADRYADAADDHNLIHLDDAVARSAGHPSRIVHGMCTLATGVARVGAALTAQRPGRELDYVSVRFTRPVLPGDEVVYTASATAAGDAYVLGARVGGRPVLKSAWLRYRPR
jgi:acyl dehydratase